VWEVPVEGAFHGNLPHQYTSIDWIEIKSTVKIQYEEYTGLRKEETISEIGMGGRITESGCLENTLRRC
jgi:hypothetical protein